MYNHYHYPQGCSISIAQNRSHSPKNLKIHSFLKLSRIDISSFLIWFWPVQFLLSLSLGSLNPQPMPQNISKGNASAIILFPVFIKAFLKGPSGPNFANSPVFMTSILMSSSSFTLLPMELAWRGYFALEAHSASSGLSDISHFLTV